jgi:hypothetical protein
MCLLDPPNAFVEREQTRYVDEIKKVADQDRIMTPIGGNVVRMQQRGSEIDAGAYVVDNISQITSIYMLDILIGLFWSFDAGPEVRAFRADKISVSISPSLRDPEATFRGCPMSDRRTGQGNARHGYARATIL